MFYGPKKKAQKTAEQQEKLENLTQAVDKITESADLASDILDEIEKEQESFDKEFAQVVEYMNQIQKDEEEQLVQVEANLQRFKAVSTVLKEKEQMQQDFFLQLKGQEEELLGIVEQNKHFTSPMRTLKRGNQNSVKELEAMRVQIEQMKEIGKQMSVLALNSAIEAGRMGIAGKKFIEAADEVRKCAGQYQATAELLEIRINAMQEQLQDSQQGIEQLNGLLKENNVGMGKLTKNFQKKMTTLEEAVLTNEGSESEELLQAFAEAGNITGSHGSDFEEMISHIENAGERFMKEQQEIENLKEQIKRIQIATEKVEKE